MEQFTQDPQALFDYDVVADGDKIGSVDNVWVDDATNAPEFVGVKTGWLLGHSHIVPLADAQVSDHTINVPYSQDQIKNAPSYSGDQDLSPDQEQQVYDYYGLQRSTQATPSGYGTDQGTGTQGQYSDQMQNANEITSQYVGGPEVNQNVAQYGNTGTLNTGLPEQALSEQQTIDVPLTEEELQVGKRQVQAGEIRLRKIVRTEHREIPVELRREEIEIQRVNPGEGNVPDNAFQEGTITIPIMEEQAVVSKEAVVTGEVQIGKRVETETETVEADVRREELEVDTDNTDLVTNNAGDLVDTTTGQSTVNTMTGQTTSNTDKTQS